MMLSRLLNRFPLGILAIAITALWLVGPVPGTAQSVDRESTNLLSAIVALESKIPDDARTAGFLGEERQGTGVVIDDDGLVLTIGYLILEAESITLTTAKGRKLRARILAYDHESGLGLVRAEKPIEADPMKFGDSASLKETDSVVAVSAVGPAPIVATRVVSRRLFTGGWEYLLESAIFTSPPHWSHSGAVLLDSTGKLMGIGSLLVNNARGEETLSPGNMFVPINVLKPVFKDLVEKGQRQTAPRPWIGANTQEFQGRLVVSRVSPDGPAASAGLSQGDIIVGLNGDAVEGQADFYRKLWAAGSAGVRVELNVLPKGEPTVQPKDVFIDTKDRSQWLRTGGKAI